MRVNLATDDDRHLMTDGDTQANIQERTAAILGRRRLAGPAVLLGGLLLLVAAAVVSLCAGASHLSLGTVWHVVMAGRQHTMAGQIVLGLRLPRTLCAVLVGAAFAVAGAMMQGLTRNPLADSGLLGLNAGAGFVLALCFALFRGLPYVYLALFSFLGAAAAAGLVYGIGSLSKAGLTPVRLTLAGAAIGALFTALSQAIAIRFEVGQDLAFWSAGGISGATWLQVKLLLPWVGGALVAALFLARSITVLSLGDELAVNLGQRTRWVKLGAALTVLVLAGSSVSVVGSISFVGLIVPHVVRFLVGVDYRWVIACSAVFGSLLVLVADIAARLVNPPYETPVGALIALIGVPFFLFLARRRVGRLAE
nr:iron ABC transporter permease [Alicyclobacillus shizuokensis]